MGHADLHRLVKEMVKAEVQGLRKSPSNLLSFSTSISNILMKDFEATIKSRAIFILIELIENEETNGLVIKQCKASKPVIEKIAAKDKSTGLQILIKKL